MESKELLILNPLLLDDSLEKYIWVNDSNEGHRNAQYLFGYLMKRDIYINGFATSSPSMAGLKMYHKKIVGLDFSQQENTAVFYDIWSKDIWKIYKERGHKARIINPDLDRENIVIWGSGVTGVEVFKILEAAGIKALFFVDSNESLVGTMKCGLPVCSPDALEKNFTVIEAMENWRQLDNEICAKYSKRVHFSFHIVWNEITCDDDGIEKNVLSLSQFWPCNRFEGKKIYVYGTGNVEKTFVNCLKLLDYEFGGFLVDDTNELEESGSLVKNVEEILYEDNYYVWVYDELKNQRLKELGLGYYSEYECAISAYGIATDAKFCIDVNFGHTYLTTSKYSGITVYGEENEKDYKIAVLGGSTTDGAAFPFQSWSRILHEKLWDGITVYNGGVSGYASGQELVKLIRDILPLKPDMVVVYDGFNELNTDAQYPFAFPYSKEVSNYAIKHLDESAQGCYERQVALGVRSKKIFSLIGFLTCGICMRYPEKTILDFLHFVSLN